MFWYSDILPSRSTTLVDTEVVVNVLVMVYKMLVVTATGVIVTVDIDVAVERIV